MEREIQKQDESKAEKIRSKKREMKARGKTRAKQIETTKTTSRNLSVSPPSSSKD